MRKALNFDIDTKLYEQMTGKPAPTAYYEIRKYLEHKGFEHRQGSGYVSNKSLNDAEISYLAKSMSKTISWLKDCVKQFDVTNVGRQFSLMQTFTTYDEIQNQDITLEDVKHYENEPDITDDF